MIPARAVRLPVWLLALAVSLVSVSEVTAWAAGDPATVSQAAGRVRERASQAPPSLAAEFRAMAAKALEPGYPDLARKLASEGQPAPPAAGAKLAAAAARAPDPPEVAAIRKRAGQMRGLPTDADRARLAIEVAGEIRALPPGPAKLRLASGICNLATEGDLRNDALAAVSATLAEAIRQTQAGVGDYLELASLVRYEHVPAPPSDPALEAADAVLALQQAIIQETDFTLTGLDGKSYSLSALRGRVVLVNFWATWCPPCRKEMPDIEKLYRQFRAKGLTVLAISDEARDTVTGYLAKQDYSFPVLLDPGRKVNSAFQINGIPKTFVFDREGKLAAQSVDMRTERQFLEMLKRAELE